MKRIIFALSLILIAITVNAQWNENGTNLTTTDNVGIGTTPTSPLHIFQSGPYGLRFERGGHDMYEIKVAGSKGIRFTNLSDLREEMVFDGNGRIGIGLESPSYTFDVNGNIRTLNHFISGSNQSNGRLYLRDTNGSNKVLLQSDGLSYFDAGYLGIGITNPSSPLHIFQSGPYGLRFERSGHDMYEIKVAGSKGIRITNLTDGREEMVFDGNGKVGIGTETMGSHKLAVDGSIGAREIKVEASGWSDFVFENDYELRSLEEVEQHINKKGHLPEIPSEAEVTENGINLGEMNAKLLQKIEELTLYMINMNKQMQTQAAEIENLKSENSVLKEKVNSLENK